MTCRAAVIPARASSVSAISSPGLSPTFAPRRSSARASSPEPAPPESREKKKGLPAGWPVGARVALAGGGDRLRELREHLERFLAQLLVVVEDGPGGDQLADDHVFLQATEPVDLARNGGFGQHPRRLLEGCRREPAGRVERGLDEAEQYGLRHRWIAAFRQHFGVRFLVLPLGDDLARQQVGVAGRINADLPHHLPDDHLDVLVVDIDALRAVHLLDLVYQVGLNRLAAEDVEQFLRADRAFGDLLPGLDLLTALDVDPRAVGDRVLAPFLVHAPDHDLVALDARHAGRPRLDGLDLAVSVRTAGNLLAFLHGRTRLDRRLHLVGEDVGDVVDVARRHLDLAGGLGPDDLHLAIDLGDDRLALRDTGFEEFLDARQALRDVGARDATGMEGPHGELRTGFADRLGSDDAHRLTDLDQLAGRQVAAVAQAADALARLAGEHRANFDLGNARLDQVARLDVADLGAFFDERLLRVGVQDRSGGHATRDPLEERLGQRAFLRDVRHPDAARGAAVLGPDDHVLGHVDQPAREITRVRGAQRRVGETLAGAVGRDEVLEHGEPFGEVRLDRKVDDPAGRVGHQAAHPGQLPDLLDVPASAGVGHHEDRVKRVEALHRGCRDFLRRLGPEVDGLGVALVDSDQAALELQVDVAELLFRARQDGGLARRRLDVHGGDRDAGLGGVGEADPLDVVGDPRGQLVAVEAETLRHDRPQRLLVEDMVLVGHRLAMTLRRLHPEGQYLVEEHPARRGADHRAIDPDTDLLLDVDAPVVEGEQRLLGRAVGRQLLVLDVGCRLDHGQVVGAEHDVLGRADDRVAIRRRQDVVGRHHQIFGFRDGAAEERNVDRHLVAVEVRVEGAANERVDLDRRPLDEHRHERLDAEAVKRGRAVEEHRMLLDHLIEHVPHFGADALHHALGGLDVLRVALADQLAHDEWLEELERHLLGEPALVQLQLRADHDDGAARVVDTLAEQVLPEAALLAFEHVGQ